MTEAFLSWFYHLAERDISAIIGLSFIGLSAIVWYVQKENRIGNGLYDIAAAIRERKK